MALLVSNVDWRGEDADPVPDLLARLRVGRDDLRAWRLVRKSLDARHKKQRWMAAFRVEVADEAAVLARKLPSVRAWTERDDLRYGLVETNRPKKPWPRHIRPIVVGAGPAGLFAALHLAEQGAPVLLLDRGGPVEDRVPAVNEFWRRKAPLDPENNLLFGEGGAGTFSDGKIYTRRRDGDLGYLFRRLVEFGADGAILQESYAHLGTDKVRAILPVFRQRLVELGVDVRYHARVDELIVHDGACVGVVLADGTEERGGPVIVAAGHSARDAGAMLIRAGVRAEARPIAVGARIEHPQALIDAAQYGRERGALPAASYRLAWNPSDRRHAHTFCMCPGGMVVPAANQPERVVVNGMSFAARRAFWANSAVVVEVQPEDYAAALGEPTHPDHPALAGYAWQDVIERRCFQATGGDYRAPAQRVVDLESGRVAAELPKTSFPMGVGSADLRELLPPYVIEGMLGAIRSFDRKIPGFAGEEALLIAPETRTTSPVRFLRDERRQATTVADLFPVGEGAGYGGGIISCALDGYRAARAVCEAALR